jgi:hypothetical protein
MRWAQTGLFWLGNMTVGCLSPANLFGFGFFTRVFDRGRGSRVREGSAPVYRIYFLRAATVTDGSSPPAFPSNGPCTTLPWQSLCSGPPSGLTMSWHLAAGRRDAHRHRAPLAKGRSRGRKPSPWAITRTNPCFADGVPLRGINRLLHKNTRPDSISAHTFPWKRPRRY